MKPKVLIVGTVPYNRNMTSRAFESYFSGWEHDRLAQIFSNESVPLKGHCETLFQITDKRMFKRKFSRRVETGKIYSRDFLPEQDACIEPENVGFIYKILYKIGKFHSPLTHLLRQWIWNKKHWCTENLNYWLDEFAPECVFLSFSDDFFILQIALYAAKRYNIPIVSAIGDDYCFNMHFSLSPFYYIYKYNYMKLVRDVFSYKGNTVYISDKIRDVYNKSFGLNGKTVYLASDVTRRNFREIDSDNPYIGYFGNIGLGRSKSLADIGNALGMINPDYRLNVYSNENRLKDTSVLYRNPYVSFHGSIPYNEVKLKSMRCDIIVLVEGFSKSDIDKTRYSLSTKAADALASGSNIFVYGPLDCGLIQYMSDTGGAEICTDPEKLEDCIRRYIGNPSLQKRNYDAAVRAVNENHTLKVSTSSFEKIIAEAVYVNK